MNPHDVVNPRCLRCRKRCSAHRRSMLAPVLEGDVWVTRMEYWCGTGPRAGKPYLPQLMSDAEANDWANRLSVVWIHRNTDF